MNTRCFPLLLTIPLVLCFSDQEPPYSMITLHEMAETGKEQLHCSVVPEAHGWGQTQRSAPLCLRSGSSPC